jgi:thiol-disulfide isomerase/thioredoxin
MVFLHINEDSKNHEKLDDSIKDGKQVFLLIFMVGCGPCEATKPEWLKLENDLDDAYNTNEDIIIADLDQSLLSSLKNLPKQPAGFPTMYYIANSGKTCEDFDNRDVKSFIKWIESKSKKQKGGNKRIRTNKNTRKRNKKSKKSKKSKKRKHHSHKRNKK